MNKKLYFTMLALLIVGGIAYFAYFGLDLVKKEKEPDYEVAVSEVIEGTSGYGVSASHPLAVKVGKEILEKGGHAVDAAIAVSYVLGVVEPYGSGIGGGGVMIVLEKDSDDAVAYDYRETAPLSGEISPDHVGIPGFVKGMEAVHKEYGKLPMAELIQPAIELAEEGFPIDSHLHERLDAASFRMPIYSLPHFYPNGEALQTNEELKQPELAETLRLIQEHGADAFYRGEVGQSLLGKIGQFTENDLETYEVVKSPAVRGKFSDLEVLSAPGPASGPTLIQALQMADILNLESTKNNEADFIHLTSEIVKAVYKDRLKTVGDPDFYNGDIAANLSLEYSRSLAEQISLDELSDDYELNDSIADEEDHDNTTHFVVLDKEGNMVSVTNTLGNFFGSGVYMDGYFLNSQMSNFSKSGKGINRVEPGKRPRSFIAPTILRNDDYLIGIGSPGGKRIPAVITQVLLRHYYFEEPLQAAVDYPRFYAEGDVIYVESGFSDETLDNLRQKGYHVIERNAPTFYGAVQTITIDKKQNQTYGTSDKRRNGTQWIGRDSGTEDRF